MNKTATNGPLDGVRIADLTTVVMGPLATRILGDLGAEVIRVEAPDYDFMRDFDPKRSPGMSAFTLNLNRNKRSVVFDLKTDDGHQAMLDLVSSCDVFVSNMRPAALAKLGLAPDDLMAVKQDLIYVGAVGFGSDGPYAGQAAYDDVIQAVSGLASMFSWADGEPRFVPSVMADKVSGLHIVYAVTAALYQKAVSGRGDVIEVPMAEVMAAFNLVEHQNGHTFEPKESPFSYRRLRTVNRKPRRSADGWICIMPYSDQNYRDFFTEVGKPELIDDERFRTVNDRVVNVDELYAHVGEAVAGRTTAEWMEFSRRTSIPCVPVVELDQVADNPHFAEVGLIEVDEHPSEGAYHVVHDPVWFQSRPVDVRRHAPRVGEHTDEILTELGWSEDRIKVFTNNSE